MEIALLTTFLGWCTVINIGLLALTTVALAVFRPMVLRIHGALLGMTPEQLLPKYVNYLACFKVLVIVLNLVPWIALKLM